MASPAAEYPAHLARERRLADGRTVLIRPVRADDEGRERTFLSRLSAESRQLRFLKLAGALTGKVVHFFTHVDYDRHMAFVCEVKTAAGAELAGEARYVANPDGRSCEFGVVVADDWRHTGVAQLLMDALIRAAQARKLETMEGLVLAANAGMLDFVRELGFEASPVAEDATLVRVVRRL